MKKLLVIILVLLFATAALSAFSAETTFKGEYRVRAWSEYNFDKKVEDVGLIPSHENAQYDGWFEQRFRLIITHERSEFLKAVIRLDLVEDTWGQQRNLLINNNNAGNFIDLAYIEFTIPKLGTFTVGKFPETYGHGLVFSDEGTGPVPLFLDNVGSIGLTGARWANSWGPVALSLLYAKVSDRITLGATFLYNWDADLFAMNLKISPAENHVIELFGGYLQDNEALVGVFADSFSFITSTVFLTGVGAPYDADIGFAGIAYTGNIADMFDIKFENSYIIGHASRHYWGGGAFPFVTPGMGPNYPQPTLTIQGYNIYADVSYYNDLFRVGLAFIMGSGQHHVWNTNSRKSINLNYISQDRFTFNQILVNGGGGLNSVYGNHFSLFGKNSLENITAVKLYFEICPIEKLTLNTSVTWAKWTEDVGINLFGTRAALVRSKGSSYIHPASIYGNYIYNSWDTSDDLGWEVDFGFSYEIMEGLTYSFSMGVLFTGDSWDYEKADGTRGDWGEIWSITNSLLYEF